MTWRALTTWPFRTAAQGLRQMALSTWRPLECQAVARELEAWCAAAAPAQGVSPIAAPEDALRMRASLQRAQRWGGAG
jgi:phosphoglucan,water dikinase